MLDSNPRLRQYACRYYTNHGHRVNHDRTLDGKKSRAVFQGPILVVSHGT